MDRDLYVALTDDDIDVLKRKNWLRIRDQMTPTNNTVLHVACQHGSIACVKEILSADELLIFQTNSRGETALHLAARQGHYEAVEALVSKAKQSNDVVEALMKKAIASDQQSNDVVTALVKKAIASDQQSESSDDDLENPTSALEILIRASNVEFETALHAAVRYNHENVVGVLVKEDPRYSYPQNKSDETPLYLAAVRGYDAVTQLILDYCKSPTFGGPQGRTALHAATLSLDRGYECMRILLRSNRDLIEEPDDNGWTAFHFAADNNLPGCILFLLDANRSVAYVADKKDKKTPLHVAAYKGYVEVILILLEYLPDIVDNVDGNGQNMFHIVLKQNISRYFWKSVLSKPWKFDTLNTLMIQKDMEGNTPLLLIAKLGYYIPELRELIQKTDQHVVDNTNMTPSEAFAEFFSPLVLRDEDMDRGPSHRDMDYDLWIRWIAGKAKLDRYDRKSPEVRMQELKQTANSHMVVAALVTTVALTAGFAMPGGFNGTLGSDQGSPLLLRKPAFNIFVVADTIALLLSISSLFLYFSLSFKLKKSVFFDLFTFAVMLNSFSVVAMMVAFMGGTYAVLSHSLALAIAVCTLSSLFILLVFRIIYRYITDIFLSPILDMRHWLSKMHYMIRYKYRDLVIAWMRRVWDTVWRPCQPASNSHSSGHSLADLV